MQQHLNAAKHEHNDSHRPRQAQPAGLALGAKYCIRARRTQCFITQKNRFVSKQIGRLNRMSYEFMQLSCGDALLRRHAAFEALVRSQITGRSAVGDFQKMFPARGIFFRRQKCISSEFFCFSFGQHNVVRNTAVQKSAKTPNCIVPIWSKITGSAGINGLMENIELT
jgi:hypothetical protein